METDTYDHDDTGTKMAAGDDYADGEDAAGGFPFTASDLGRMALESYDRLERFRDVRTKLIAEYVGPHYLGDSIPVGDEGTNAEQVNLIQQSVEALLPNLVAKTISPSVTPRSANLAVEAMARERTLERTCDQINLVDTHGMAVLDSLLGPMGIVWVGIKAGNDTHTVMDRQFASGQFTAAAIDFDDYVIDQSAKRRTQALFEGHRTRMTIREAKAARRMDGSPLYNHEVLESIDRLRHGDKNIGETQKLSGNSRDPYEVAGFIEVWHLAVYVDGLTYICVIDQLGSEAKFLREPYVYWGPAEGPYRHLSYLNVPNNAVPLAFANRVRDLHDAMRRLSSKIIGDVLTAKDVGIFAPGSEDLTEAINRAVNGQWIKGDPTSITRVTMGAELAKLFPVLDQIRSMANDATGGSQLEGGAKDNSKTATGASIIAGKQANRAEWMGSRSLAFLSSIIQAAAWYQAHDPFLQATVVQRLPGGLKVELLNTAELAQGSYDDFAFKVDALLNRQIDPMVRASKLIELVGQLPAIASLGPQAFSKIMTILASSMDIPELDEINPDQTSMMATQQQMAMQQQQTGGPGGGGASDAKPTIANQTNANVGARRPGAMMLSEVRGARGGMAPV